MKLDQLTFFRFLAALVVVIFHYGRDTGLARICPEIFNSGPEMVCFFFVLSGFIMVVVYSGQNDFNAKSYWLARFARIAPVYYLALGLSLALPDKGTETGPAAVVLNSLFLQGWVPPFPLSVNPPGWSLSVEMFFYTIFPFMFFFFRSKRFTSVLIAVAVVWAGSQILLLGLINSKFYTGNPSVSHDVIFYLPLSNLNSFLIGIAGGFAYVKKLRPLAINHKVSALVTITSFILLLVALNGKKNLYWLATLAGLEHLNAASGLISPIFLVFIIGLALDRSWLSRILSAKPLVFLGDISYSIYILQHPLHVAFTTWCGVWVSAAFHLDRPQRFYVYTIMLLVASAVTYLGFEKPAREIVKNVSGFVRRRVSFKTS